MNPTHTHPKTAAATPEVRSEWQQFRNKIENNETLFPPNRWLSTKDVGAK